MPITQAASEPKPAPARGQGGGEPPQRPPFAWGIVGALAALKLALHVATNLFTPYGVHRDELLYLAMGRHLQLWKMDFPPLIAVLAQAQRAAFGDSLLSIRLAAAIAGTLLVVLAALVAREAGGGRFSQGAAAVGMMSGVLWQRSANLFQPVVFDQLWWTLALFALLCLCRSKNPRWWLAVGLACGIGLLTKFSILFFGVALFGAMLLTKHRWWLFTPWPWAALALALAIGSPSIVGQVRLGFPVRASMSELSQSQLAHVGHADFLLGQVMMVGPAILLALAGVWTLLIGRARAFRIAGWACVLAVALLMVLHGKPYYAGPVYPTLIGAGAAALGGVRVRFLSPALRWGAVAAMVAGGLFLLPLGIPILPPVQMRAYTQAAGLSVANRNNRGQMERLPQDYADMLPWEDQVAQIARVYRKLPPEKRARAVIFAGNYGEAGAIDFYGPKYGLPRAVSDAGTYWFFGPGRLPGAVLITIGKPDEDLRPFFSTVTRYGWVDNAWWVSEERDNTIYVAEGPKTTLQALWPRIAGKQ
ncbi:MAG TPA: glycosyltransferase family 39 protein [Longimicrobium sp.]|nr:glycosyltransferase family 39 protein [Longimicrobium sp.]